MSTPSGWEIHEGWCVSKVLVVAFISDSLPAFFSRVAWLSTMFICALGSDVIRTPVSAVRMMTATVPTKVSTVSSIATAKLRRGCVVTVQLLVYIKRIKCSLVYNIHDWSGVPEKYAASGELGLFWLRMFVIFSSFNSLDVSRVIVFSAAGTLSQADTKCK